MKVRTKFRAFNRTYIFNLDTDKLDRNYGDEGYGYWIKERDGYFFEIDIYKKWDKEDNCERFTDEGLVIMYANQGDFEDARECGLLDIKFIIES